MAAPSPARAARKVSPSRFSPRARYALWAAAALALALVAYVFVRRRASSSSSSSTDTSGRPGPDLSGSSAAQQPGGGASSSPGQLPLALVTQPDTLQQQVQTTDASSPDVPTAGNPALHDALVASGITPGGAWNNQPGIHDAIQASGITPGNIGQWGTPTQPATPAASPVATTTPTESMIASHYRAGRDPSEL